MAEMLQCFERLQQMHAAGKISAPELSYTRDKLKQKILEKGAQEAEKDVEVLSGASLLTYEESEELRKQIRGRE